MTKFIIATDDAIDTKIRNTRHQEAEEKGTLHEENYEDLFTDREDIVILDIVEAKSKQHARELAHAYLVEQELDTTISIIIYQLA